MVLYSQSIWFKHVHGGSIGVSVAVMLNGDGVRSGGGSSSEHVDSDWRWNGVL